MTITDAERAGGYPHDLYRPDQVGRIVGRIEDVSDVHVNDFHRSGYLAVARVFDEEDIRGALDGLATVLRAPGEATIQYEAGFQHRCATDEDGMDSVRKFMGFCGDDSRLDALARDERIVSVVRALTGSTDLAMIQDMALLKPPGGGREKPWHQDNAFFGYEPGTPIIGVWIALDEATIENGCMHVVPGSHNEGPVAHFRRRDWQICDADVHRTRDHAIPLPAGGVLFFHGLLHHGTPANNTTTRRRALQFHYVPAGTPTIEDGRRLEIFGGEGLGATC